MLHNFIKRVDHVILFFMKWSLFFIMGTMTAVVLAGVLCRYVLKAPLPWSEELARYLMVWGASLGASVAFREGSHIALTAIVERVPGIIGKILTWVAQIVVIVFMMIVTKEGFLLALKLRVQASPAMEIPMTWPYLAISVGCFFILIQALIVFTKSIFLEAKEPHSANLS